MNLLSLHTPHLVPLIPALNRGVMAKASRAILRPLERGHWELRETSAPMLLPYLGWLKQPYPSRLAATQGKEATVHLNGCGWTFHFMQFEHILHGPTCCAPISFAVWAWSLLHTYIISLVSLIMQDTSGRLSPWCVFLFPRGHMRATKFCLLSQFSGMVCSMYCLHECLWAGSFHQQIAEICYLSPNRWVFLRELMWKHAS